MGDFVGSQTLDHRRDETRSSQLGMEPIQKELYTRYPIVARRA